MPRNTIVIAAFVIWAALFAGSFLSFALTAPTDMGFTRGLNRVAGFIGWQGGAVAAAAAAMIAGAPLKAGPLRWLARIPLLAELTLLAALGALIAYTLLTQTPASDMPPALEPTEPTLG